MGRGPASLQPWELSGPELVHGHPSLSGHDLQKEAGSVVQVPVTYSQFWEKKKTQV